MASYINDGNEGAEAQALSDEITKAIGQRRHLLYNYLPWMLSAMAVDEALALCASARERREEPLRKVCQRLRRFAELWRADHMGHGEKRRALTCLLSSWDEDTHTDQWLSELSARDSARNELAANADADCAKHATMAYVLARRVAEIDAEAVSVLSRLLGRPLRRNPNKWWAAMRRALEEVRALGYVAKGSKAVHGWVKVFETKATLLMDETIQFEGKK